MAGISSTQDVEYTRRLVRLQSKGWKRFVDVQAPYRWNIRRLRPGFVLEVGCGIGRNLHHLDGNGVGIDHNMHSVQICRERGFRAFTTEEFPLSEYAKCASFDSVLLSHVAEHMSRAEVSVLLRTYVPLLKHDGRIILITPQEAGYRSDASHVEFMNCAKLASVLSEVGFKVEAEFSFPFPRFAGHLFLYNEFVVVGERAD